MDSCHSFTPLSDTNRMKHRMEHSLFCRENCVEEHTDYQMDDQSQKAHIIKIIRRAMLPI